MAVTKYEVSLESDDVEYATSVDNVLHPDNVFDATLYLQAVLDAHATLWKQNRIATMHLLLVKTAQDCLDEGKKFSIEMDKVTGEIITTCV